jgi:hypothetical protein
MEVKLPDPASFSSPHFDLIRVETGDDDGFVTAEFKADYRSDAYDGQSFKSGLTVQNPIALDVALPGTDPSAPFIHNALKKVGLQFAYADNSEEEMEIGGKLVFEGDFTFRPLVPADMPFAEHFNLLMQHVGLMRSSAIRACRWHLPKIVSISPSMANSKTPASISIFSDCCPHSPRPMSDPTVKRLKSTSSLDFI